MKKSGSRSLTLEKIERNFKTEKIMYSKSGNTITAFKKKTLSEGHKVEIKLSLEARTDRTIVGSVRGFGKTLIAVPADQAIAAYRARIALAR